jgi:hypothetical protein
MAAVVFVDFSIGTVSAGLSPACQHPASRPRVPGCGARGRRGGAPDGAPAGGGAVSTGRLRTGGRLTGGRPVATAAARAGLLRSAQARKRGRIAEAESATRRFWDGLGLRKKKSFLAERVTSTRSCDAAAARSAMRAGKRQRRVAHGRPGRAPNPIQDARGALQCRTNAGEKPSGGRPRTRSPTDVGRRSGIRVTPAPRSTPQCKPLERRRRKSWKAPASGRIERSRPRSNPASSPEKNDANAPGAQSRHRSRRDGHDRRAEPPRPHPRERTHACPAPPDELSRRGSPRPAPMPEGTHERDRPPN